MASIKELKKDVSKALGQHANDCYIVDFVMGQDSDVVGDIYSETYARAEELFGRIKAYPKEKGVEGRKARRAYFKDLERQFQELFDAQADKLIALVEKISEEE